MNRTRYLFAAVLGISLTSVAIVYGQIPLLADIKQLAAEIKKGKGKAKAGLKQDDLEELMHSMKPSAKGGLKVGNIDGLEKMIQMLARPGGVPNLAMNDLEEAGYIFAAIGLVTETMPTDKAKKEKLWKTYSDQMVDGGKKLSAAAKAGVAADIKTAAVAINNSCNACHSKYR